MLFAVDSLDSDANLSSKGGSIKVHLQENVGMVEIQSEGGNVEVAVTPQSHVKVVVQGASEISCAGTGTRVLVTMKIQKVVSIPHCDSTATSNFFERVIKHQLLHLTDRSKLEAGLPAVYSKYKCIFPFGIFQPDTKQFLHTYILYYCCRCDSYPGRGHRPRRAAHHKGITHSRVSKRGWTLNYNYHM
jgi:hypothetical protein